MTAATQQAATAPLGPTGKLATWVAELSLSDVPAAGGGARQTPVARRDRLRTHRRTAAVVADGHRSSAGHRRPRRHRRHRHGTHRQRTGRGGAERHVHPGFRARRLPSDRAATQLLAADPRAAVDRVVAAGCPWRRAAARRDRRVRGRTARRLHPARRRNARPRLAFRIGLRHPFGCDGLRQAARPVPRPVGGRTRPGGHPVVRPDGRPVRGDEQAHASRPCRPQRFLCRGPRNTRLHRDQARLRTRIRRISQCFRRRPSPRRGGTHQRSRQAMGNVDDHGQVLRRDGRSTRRDRRRPPPAPIAGPATHLAHRHHRRHHDLQTRVVDRASAR